jgi:aminoglycoside 6'-N-acetyltransferase
MADDGNIVLRKAGIKDLKLLRYWDKQPHVIASDDDLGEENWPYELQRQPNWRDQFIAELAGRPIGCLQIIDPAEEESHYWCEVSANLRAIDIWIGEKDDLRKGYGTIMMTLALRHCFKNKAVTAVLIDPLATNKGAILFYESLGFKFVEARTFGKSECVVYRLYREDWQRN